MSNIKLYDLSGVRVNRIFNNPRKENYMKNSNIVISLASVGLFANLFVLLAGDNLKNSTGDLFGVVGSLCFCAAFILFLLNQKCETEVREERNEIYRDFDAVYRYVDDVKRDLETDIRDCSRASQCCTESKKR